MAESINSKHQQGLREMQMHEKFWKNQKELPLIDHPRSVECLHKAHLRYETKSCLCAAQEQVLATGYLRACIWGDGSSGLCCLCK